MIKQLELSEPCPIAAVLLCRLGFTLRQGPELAAAPYWVTGAPPIQITATLPLCWTSIVSSESRVAPGCGYLTIMDAQRGDGTNPEAELALKAQEANAKIAIKERETEGKLQLQAQKQAGDAALAQQKQANDIALKQRDQMHAQAMQDRNAAADIAMRDRASTADIARKDQQAKAAARRPKPQPAR